MVRLLLMIALWVTLAGFVLFCLLYAILARPWHDHMGKHVLAFMGGLAIAFIYAAAAPYVPDNIRLEGWTIILTILGALVWWRVVLLIKFQVEARQPRSSDELDNVSE